jgi:hypothetical protein
MRGVRDGTSGAVVPGPHRQATAGATGDEALALLTEIRDSLRRFEERLGTTGRGA